jgi:hypothetical protein
MVCDYCRAPIRDSGAFCAHCGTRIQRPPRGEAASLAATDPARYDLVQASPGYPIASRHQPPVSTTAGIAMPVVSVALLLVFMSFISRTMPRPMPAPFGGFAVPFYAIPVVIMVMMCVAAARGLRYHRAPIQHAVLVVVDERTKVSSGGKQTAVSTTYYATLQARDGGRVEYETSDLLAGRIAPGDIGVAYLKAHRLVDFRRFDV